MIYFCVYICRMFWGNKCFHSFIHSFIHSSSTCTKIMCAKTPPRSWKRSHDP